MGIVPPRPPGGGTSEEKKGDIKVAISKALDHFVDFCVINDVDMIGLLTFSFEDETFLEQIDTRYLTKKQHGNKKN